MSATEMPVVLAGGTKIEWAHFTFNPVWGCCRVSPACRLCYAEALAKRYGHDVWGATAGRRTFGDAHWREPLKWNRKAGRDGVRRRVFCASMADVFEDHPAWPEQRARLWGLIGDTANLDWLLLTKRPQNIPAMVPAAWMAGEWPAHMWAGATVEDQQCAELRIPQLQVVPAPVRFLSCEPLLGAFPRLDLTGIGWVIVGGETGPDSRRREMDLDALAAVADTCDRTVVPLFVKQDSGRHPGRQGRIPDSLWARKDVPQPERLVDISEGAT
jgi:protein gp37